MRHYNTAPHFYSILCDLFSANLTPPFCLSADTREPELPPVPSADGSVCRTLLPPLGRVSSDCMSPLTRQNLHSFPEAYYRRRLPHPTRETTPIGAHLFQQQQTRLNSSYIYRLSQKLSSSIIPLSPYPLFNSTTCPSLA